MTRSKFDIQYNKWLQQVDVEEEDAVWNEIQDELDFMETWDNISVKLDVIAPQTGRVVRMRYLKVFAAIAAIILIMFLPVRYLIEQANQPTIISERSNEVDGKEEPLSEETLSEELLSEELLSEETISEELLSEALLSEALLSEALLSEALLSEKPLSEELLSEALLSEKPLSEELLSEELLSEELLTEELLSEALLSEALLSEKPLSEELLSEELLSEEPLSEEPLSEALLSEEPISEEPLSEELLSEEPISEEPLSEELLSEEPLSEELLSEEPLSEELLSEEPLSEELLAEETIPSNAANNEEEVQRLFTEVSPQNNSHEKSLASVSSNELMPIIESKDSESTSYSIEVRDLPGIKTLLSDADLLKASIDAIPATPSETELNLISESGKSSEISKSSGISFRVAEVGFLYGYKNTWLLNYETRNGLNPEKLGNTLPTFHQDIGMSSSFEINNRYLFGLEFLLKSGAGQNYQQYINASYTERNINLDYLKLQAFYFWDNNIFPGQAIVGGYFAGLIMAEEQQATTTFMVDDSYSNLDYGLLTGYQFNIALKNRIIFKPGVRLSYNLVNIFEGDDITPSHFKKTKNLAASFNISLSYRFFK